MNRRPNVILFLFIAFILLNSFRTMATFGLDWLWFDAVGYEESFLKMIVARLIMGGIAALIIGGMTYGSGRLALRNLGNRNLMLHVNGRLVRANSMAKTAMNYAGVVVALVSGIVGAASWRTLILFTNRTPFDHVEQIFGLDASFYVFTLPFLRVIRGYVLTGSFLALAIALGVYLLSQAVRLGPSQDDPQRPQFYADDGPKRHLAIAAALWTGVMGLGFFLDRFGWMSDQTGLVAGPGYSAVHASIPLLTVQGIAMFGGSIAVYLAFDRLRGGMLALAILLAVGSGAVALVLPNAVQSLVVEPNELEKEGFYISEHIRATRFAWGLDDVEEAELTADQVLHSQEIEANNATIQNIRLWDHSELLKAFRQVQEIRTYYDFRSVDNDRYMIDGQLRQVMLSPRELRVGSLPAQARTWVNETMIYTHGYGVAMGPVNEKTEDGLPELWIGDLPPTYSHPDAPKIDRPEVYYGEITDTPVFVRTKEREFDYPTNDGNAYTTYEGAGGMPVGGFLVRLLVAVETGSWNTVLADGITEGTRMLRHRNVVDRAREIAPFLSFDRDPYLVIDEGRMIWVLDAYTSTNDFPQSRRVSRLGNFVRNSVKITVDAYDGKVNLYLTDEAGPIANAWAAAFPEMFSPLSELPTGLQAHLRYPQDLMEVQAALFATYHMTNTQIFYNREDEWEIPALVSSSARGLGRKTMQPYYTIMRLPGESDEEFILMLPFTPRGKPNLAAWMVARADGDNYGKMRVYRFPKDKVVYGPSQVIARINQNDEISEKLTLWNQNGSSAVLGTLLVIPIEESLIYVQPLYLLAQNGSIPELKRVIVSYENEIAMEPTLEASLSRIFRGTAPARVPIALEGTSAMDAVQTTVAGSATLNKAGQYFRDAEQAAREGRWADYGTAMDALGETLSELLDESGSLDSEE